MFNVERNFINMLPLIWLEMSPYQLHRYYTSASWSLTQGNSIQNGNLGSDTKDLKQQDQTKTNDGNNQPSQHQFQQIAPQRQQDQ
jgi:hypothetical protein